MNEFILCEVGGAAAADKLLTTVMKLPSEDTIASILLVNMTGMVVGTLNKLVLKLSRAILSGSVPTLVTVGIFVPYPDELLEYIAYKTIRRKIMIIRSFIV
jgi:hypothetical protein